MVSRNSLTLSVVRLFFAIIIISQFPSGILRAQDRQQLTRDERTEGIPMVIPGAITQAPLVGDLPADAKDDVVAALSLVNRGHLSEMQERFKHLISTYPDNADLPLLYANTLATFSQFDFALTTLKEARSRGIAAEQIDTMEYAIKSIQGLVRREKETDPNWKPDWDEYGNIGSLPETSRNKKIWLITVASPGSRLSFHGNIESPFTLAFAFKIWDGAIFNDPQQGFSFDDLTKFSYPTIKNGKVFYKFGRFEKQRLVSMSVSEYTLHQRYKEDHLDVVKLLLESKADVNAEHTDGRTALMAAAQNGHLEIVKMLLESKADVNAKDNDGVTALMLAAVEGHVDVVKI